MLLTVTPLEKTLGAKITGVDLGDLDEASWNLIQDAFHEYAVLIFPEQHLNDAEQVTFGERFGRIEILRPDGKKAAPISNKAADGHILSPDEKRYQTLRGNEGWHTDSSYMRLAAKASILSCQVATKTGGETEFCDMRDAYDALDDAMKAKVEGLSAYHSLYVSQAKAGFTFRTGEAYGYHTDGMPLRPLVKVHPVTGRKALYVGRHAWRIPGMEDAEAQGLFDALHAFALKPQRIYTHAWRPGDVVMWDNRSVLHRACEYDYSEPRVMRHVRIAGESESELAQTAPDERADAFAPA